MLLLDSCELGRMEQKGVHHCHRVQHRTRIIHKISGNSLPSLVLIFSKNNKMFFSENGCPAISWPAHLYG